MRDEFSANLLARETQIREIEQQNRKTEIEHEKIVSELRVRFMAELVAARENDARRIADLRNGSRRLRLRVAKCSADAGANTGSAAGDDGTRVAELTRETASALFTIAADGDRAIMRLTALQKWAREAYRLCGRNPDEY